MELLKHYINSKEKDLFAELANGLKEKYFDVAVKDNSYIYAKGELPVMLVAHLDTVWEDGERLILYDQDRQIMWSPSGIGADDRAGVFVIMKLLETGYRPSVLFTCGEECGGIGAAKFVMDYPKLPNVNFIIELDRRGLRDAVYYDCANPHFEEFINSFGFETAEGIFSDICVVCPNVGVAGVNLSVGFFNEHTPYEMLSIDIMYLTMRRVAKILDAENLKFEYIERKDDNNGKGCTGEAESNQQVHRGLR